MDKNFYVPILKWKRGEQIAIQHLTNDDKDKILPLIELPPIEFDYENNCPKKTIDEQVRNVANSICTNLGTRQVFLDLFKLYEECLLSNGQHPIEYIINECKSLNVNVIPVVKTNSEERYVEAVKNLLKNEEIKEICIRIEEADFLHVNYEIDNILNLYEVTSKQCYIVIDLKEKTINTSPTYELIVPLIVNNMNHLSDWITITLAVTSFPTNLDKVPKDSHRLLPRIEFGLWQNINKLLSRKIQFGDYCISNPEYLEVDPRFIQMSGNIRYTINDNYLIYKGSSTKINGFTQMKNMCSSLISTHYYLGQAFSWGDGYIYGVSNDTESTGNAETWRRVGTNHHIQLVINQLSSVSYF